MANYALTTYDDTLFGTNDYDLFSGPSGGTDHLRARGGDDVFQLDAGAAGTVNGGLGNDTVDALGIDLGSVVFGQVETLDLSGTDVLTATISQLMAFSTITASNGSLYDTIDIAGAGGRINFLPRWVAAADLHVDATSSTAAVTIIATAGNDTITGSHYADLLIGDGGNDDITANGANSIVKGGSGNDALHGSGASAIVYGNTGDDFLYANASGVTLHGGADNDKLYANAGDATLFGEAGNDALFAGASNAVLSGGGGNDTLYGNYGGATLHGDGGSDALHATADGVTLYGDDGNDLLFATADNATLYGGAGNDTLYDTYSATIHLDAGDGNDTIILFDCGCGYGTVDGGTGTDVAFENGIDLGGRAFYNIETLDIAKYPALYGSIDQFNSFQTITASNGYAITTLVLDGAGGTIDFSTLWKSPSVLGVDASLLTSAVTITGTDHGDHIAGSYHADRLYGGGGADSIYVNGQLSFVYGDAGNDGIYIRTDYAFVHGGDGNDLIVDTYGTSQLYGDNGNDTFDLYANPDSSIVSGGAGFDTVVEYGISLGDRAFTGVEALYLANYNYVTAKPDQIQAFQHIYDVSPNASSGTTIYVVGTGDTIDFRQSWNSSYTLTVNASAGGNTRGFNITGSQHGDVLIGSAYDDTINGVFGNDTIYGGLGTNRLNGGAGDDTMHAQGSRDTLIGGTGNDTLIDDSAGGSTMLGQDGDDSFNGGAGADHMIAGLGADTFIFNAVSDSTGTAFDRIEDFTSGTDVFDLWFAVTGVDATIATGTLQASHFDADLQAAVDFTQLHEHHAVLFTPDSGGFAGKTFMVVDVNGVAGYQAGQDLVIQVDGVTSLNVADFI